MSVVDELNASLKKKPAIIRLFPSMEEKAFSDFEALSAFVVAEKDFWSPMNVGMTRDIGAHFANAFSNMKVATATGDVNQADSHLKLAINLLSKNHYPSVFSTTPDARIIKRLYDSNPSEAEGYCSYQFNRPTQNTSISPALFRGMMSAFVFHDAPRDIEKIAAGRDEASNIAQHEHLSRLSHLQDEHSDLLTKNKASYESLVRDSEKWKHDLVKSIVDWSAEEKAKLADLESLYSEKLRLEGPAVYWKTLSAQYEKKGRRWRSWAVGSSLFLMALFVALLLFPSSSLPLSISSFSLESIRGLVVLAFVASVGVYIVRLFAKLSTSAFHLARDATERFYLTHLYLALANDKKIAEAERAIVLQSLFSRADTGLLRGDSSPAFPEGLSSQILKNLKL